MSDTRRVPAWTGNPRGADFAALLNHRRRELGWTHDEIVERSGVARSTVLRWFGGSVVNPRPDHIRAVCRAMGIPQHNALVALGYLTRDELERAA